MPISETSSSQIKALEGAHLYHFAMSSCSQRVRLALEEKGVEWTSHHVDLNKMENVSGWYQEIHPMGYVPAFIHDGKLITESSDIIQYIDSAFPGVSLQAADQHNHGDVKKWLALADKNQWCLKHLTYELIFKQRGHFSKQEDVDYYLANQKNAQLLQFMRDFSAGFSDEKIAGFLAEAHDYLVLLEAQLEHKLFLGGSCFSLADIANIVNVHRYLLCKLDFGPYPSILRWYAQVELRSSFREGVIRWQKAG